MHCRTFIAPLNNSAYTDKPALYTDSGITVSKEFCPLYRTRLNSWDKTVKKQYKLGVDKGQEFTLKTIIDFLLGVDSYIQNKGRIIVDLGQNRKKNGLAVKQILGNLSHVNSVKEM